MENPIHNDDERVELNSPGEDDAAYMELAGGKAEVKFFNKQDESLVQSPFKVLLEIEGVDDEGRVGVDLVTVLDISSSMNGIEKMKLAMDFLVQKLSSIDRLSVVTFNRHAVKLCPLRQITETSQTEIVDQVNDLVAGSSANTEAGLKLALKILNDRKHTKNRSVAIMLMSNCLKDAESRAITVPVGDLPVYTFAFGSECDHEVLSSIAKNSNGGTFSPIRDSDDLRVVFSSALAGLLNVAIEKLTLTVAPADSSQLNKVNADNYPQTEQTTEMEPVTVDFSSLYGREIRKVLVNLTLPKVDKRVRVQILKVAFKYRVDGKEEFDSDERIISITRTPTPKDAERPEVLAEETRTRTATSLKEARILAESKKLNDAGTSIPEIDTILEGQADHLQQLLVPREDFHESQRSTARPVGVFSMHNTPPESGYMKQAAESNRNPEIHVVPTPKEDVVATTPLQRSTARPVGVLSMHNTPPVSGYMKQAVESNRDPETHVVPTPKEVVVANTPLKDAVRQEVLVDETCIQTATPIKEAKIMADTQKLVRPENKLVEAGASLSAKREHFHLPFTFFKNLSVPQLCLLVFQACMTLILWPIKYMKKAAESNRVPKTYVALTPEQNVTTTTPPNDAERHEVFAEETSVRTGSSNKEDRLLMDDTKNLVEANKKLGDAGPGTSLSEAQMRPQKPLAGNGEHLYFPFRLLKNLNIPKLLLVFRACLTLILWPIKYMKKTTESKQAPKTYVVPALQKNVIATTTPKDADRQEVLAEETRIGTATWITVTRILEAVTKKLVEAKKKVVDAGPSFSETDTICETLACPRKSMIEKGEQLSMPFRILRNLSVPQLCKQVFGACMTLIFWPIEYMRKAAESKLVEDDKTLMADTKKIVEDNKTLDDAKPGTSLSEDQMRHQKPVTANGEHLYFPFRLLKNLNVPQLLLVFRACLTLILWPIKCMKKPAESKKAPETNAVHTLEKEDVIATTPPDRQETLAEETRIGTATWITVSRILKAVAKKLLEAKKKVVDADLSFSVTDTIREMHARPKKLLIEKREQLSLPFRFLKNLSVPQVFLLAFCMILILWQIKYMKQAAVPNVVDTEKLGEDMKSLSDTNTIFDQAQVRPKKPMIAKGEHFLLPLRLLMNLNVLQLCPIEYMKQTAECNTFPETYVLPTPEPDVISTTPSTLNVDHAIFEFRQRLAENLEILDSQATTTLSVKLVMIQEISDLARNLAEKLKELESQVRAHQHMKASKSLPSNIS